MRQRRKVEQLSATIEKLLASRGLSSRLKEYRVLGVWERAVGEGIARHARPAMVRGKKLTVTVDSSAWMQQLSLLRPEIIAKLNSAMGADAVESITLRLGELPASPRARQQGPARPLPPLAPGERERIGELAAAIADPELRRAFEHLVETDLRARRSRRA